MATLSQSLKMHITLVTYSV